jgi:hypothetical protein
VELQRSTYPGYSQSTSTPGPVSIYIYALIYSPSAPVYSTIAFTFCANSFRLLSVESACQKPEVSPHPPVAIISSFANFGRTCSTVVKRGHSNTLGSLKVEEHMKAKTTWVISDTRELSGTTSCCLDALWSNEGRCS